MKINLLILFILILVFGISVLAQDNDAEKPICEQPLSSKFDEFEFTSLEDAKERLDLYGLQLKNLKARGVVIGYGGKITESNQGRSIGFKVENYLSDKFNFSRYYTVSTIEGGHREKLAVELFIKPQNCSSDPDPSPTLSYDQVIYKEEDSFFSKDVTRKNSKELENLLINRIAEPIYPPAAKAVRARGKVLVLVLVDEKGNVIKAKAIDGHPLLRAASEVATRTWKYQIVKENNEPLKFGGKVVFDWDVIADKWQSENIISN